jgi:sigma-B regulation protein RsbU (phosphoserine phosphatase)
MTTTADAQRPGLLQRPAARSGELVVEVRDGPRVVGRQTVTAHAIIGRAADAGIRLDRGTVSRQHAEVLVDPFGRWWIRDLESRNGLIWAGRRVRERVIRDGDLFQVGDFVLAFELPAGPGSSAATTADDSLTITRATVIPVADAAAAAGISVAQDLESPRLAASHLSLLLETGREMMRAEAADARLGLLCQLMLRPEFKGTVAMALRVSADTLDAPQMLGPVQAAAGHGGRPPVSRSLLRTVIDRRAPAMAGNSPTLDQAPGMVEMSMLASVRPMCAVACPLRPAAAAGADPTDLLYVIFPPECATGEWLAIAALAAEQYALAESAWAARQEALEHATVERDLEQARHIQMRLVPADLSVPGLDVAVGFQPCRWIGGDYTDAAVLPDGRVFLAVADVCGKGLAAALVSSSLHTMVRLILDDDGSRLALDKLLGRLNRNLASYFLDGGRFVTMACAVVDPRTGAIEHANAGHPPTVVADRSGTARDLAHSTNLPLGVGEDRFIVSRDRLEPGELLAMYTDGLSEARNAGGDMIGMTRLRDEFGTIHAALARDALSASRDRVVQWVDSISDGRLPDDDRTYLLARRGRAPAP